MCLFLIAPAQAQVYEFRDTSISGDDNSHVRDAYLRGDDDTGDLNFGVSTNGRPLPDVGYPPTETSGRHHMFWFDVSTIAPGSNVTYASFNLYFYDNGPAITGYKLSPFKPGNDWIEGTKDAVLADTGEPTWNSRKHNQNTWEVAGATGTTNDIDDTKTVSFNKTASTSEYVAVDVTEMVQYLVDNPSDNHGILMWGGDGAGASQKWKVALSEDGSVGQRPYLYVEVGYITPIINTVNDTVANVGSEYTEQCSLSQGTSVTWTLLQGDSTGATIDPNTGLISGWTPGVGDVGNIETFEVKATNPYGEDTETWQVEVIVICPSINEISDTEAWVGLPYTEQLSVSQGAPVTTWTLLQGVMGAIIDPNTGLLSGWTPDISEVGNVYTFEAKATNAYCNDTETWTVTVVAAEVNLGPEHSFEPGVSCDICTNPLTGHPNIVWESADRTIRYTYYTGSAWTTTITVPGPTDVGCYEGEPLVRSADEIAVSMEIDSAGYVHVAYISGTSTTSSMTLYHIHQTASGWSAPVLVHDGLTKALSWVNLAIDSQDNLYLVFEKGYKIYVCSYNGSSWSSAQQLLSTGICHEPIVETDSQDKAHVIFSRRSGGGNPQTYYSTNQTGSWVTTMITNESAPVVDPAHAIGPSDEIHVIWGTVYTDHTDEDLEYDQYTGSVMSGTILEEQTGLETPHPRLRLVADHSGNLYAFTARRYPPELRVRVGYVWMDPIRIEGSSTWQGFWFLEADAYGNTVHSVYANVSGGSKPVTYRKVTTGPPEPLTSVSIDLGTTDVENGLSRINVGDGSTIPVTIGGRDARRNDDPTTDKYIYFDADSKFAYQGGNPDLYIQIDYYDTGTGALKLQYDSSDLSWTPNPAYKTAGEVVTLAGIDTWKEYTWHVTDAYFGNRQNGGADFRIRIDGGGYLYLDVVRADYCNTVVFADADGDGDVDQDDFAVFQICYTGVGGGIPSQLDYCQCFNRDADNDIDNNDFDAFQACATGPNIPFDPNSPPPGCIP
jgi:hypothetical protein